MQITVVRSGSSCPLGEVLEHSEKVGPGGGGVAYIYIYMVRHCKWFIVKDVFFDIGFLVMWIAWGSIDPAKSHLERKTYQNR